MNTIHRFVLTKSVNDFELPLDSKVLSVGISKENGNEEISAWIIVNTDEKSLETKRLLVFGTGANLGSMVEEGYRFIGTVQKSNMYAFHVFEVKIV